jgi:hypothetical protein
MSGVTISIFLFFIIFSFSFLFPDYFRLLLIP